MAVAVASRAAGAELAVMAVVTDSLREGAVFHSLLILILNLNLSRKMMRTSSSSLPRCPQLRDL